MGHRIPQTKSEWIEEIAEAYSDAEEAIPFGKFVGKNIEEKDFFHMAPAICLKFRGIKRTKAKKGSNLCLTVVAKAALLKKDWGRP